MRYQTFDSDSSIALFVKNILIFEEEDINAKTMLPFYADGYPGILFHVSAKGLFVMPQNKQMPNLFLYGQTIHPISLQLEGQFQIIVFQLYPFVINSFFAVNPIILNDDCYDLQKLGQSSISVMIEKMHANKNFEIWKQLLTSFLLAIFEAKKDKIDLLILQAIQLIEQNNGQQTVQALRAILHIAERTFERRFLAQVGVTPKQFSKMIQFQTSLVDITDKDYRKLTDVVYKNGFADQSHFIRVFRAFTGQTPKKFVQGLG
jgi:AraC-like DNA-binding protein